MPSSDCNSSIASTSTNNPIYSNSLSKTRRSGITKFKSLKLRGNSTTNETSGHCSECLPGGSLENGQTVELNSSQDLLVVEDVNVSIEADVTVDDDEKPSSAPTSSYKSDSIQNYSEKSDNYCPYTSIASPKNPSVEDYNNIQMNVAPIIKRPLPTIHSSNSSYKVEKREIKLLSACGLLSPTKLHLPDLSLDSCCDGVYEDDTRMGVDESEIDPDKDEDLKSISNLSTNDAITPDEEIDAIHKSTHDMVHDEGHGEDDTAAWKNFGRKENINGHDGTTDGSKKVGAAGIDTDRIMRSSNIDSDISRYPCMNLTGETKYQSDGFLDEYPAIMDEGRDSKSARIQDSENAELDVPLTTTASVQQVIFDNSLPTTASDLDHMTRFSSITGSSSVKVKKTHSSVSFNVDTSLKTSLEKSASVINKSHDEYNDNSDDNMNIWNGNGIKIAIDEELCEDSVFNNSYSDSEAAADESNVFKEGGSASRSDLVSTLTVEETIQQESAQQTNVAFARSQRQAKKQRNHIPTTTSHLHLEYNVDHSCSTPLERLARDIGNIFRQWNVHNGCDRHVSLDWMDTIVDSKDTSGTNSERVASNLQQQSDSDVTTTFTVRSKVTPVNGAQCIRQKKLIFETIGFTPTPINDLSANESVQSVLWTKRRYSIPLLLSLWDAPSISSDTQREVSIASHIPFSLRPDLAYSSHALLGELGIVSSCGTKRIFSDEYSKCVTESSQNVAFGYSTSPLDTGFGRDISSLFNIGQHITLSLDLNSAQFSSQSNQDNKYLQDIQAMYDDMYAYIFDTVEQSIEKKALAARERQHRLNRQQKRASKTNALFSCHHYKTKDSIDNHIVAVGPDAMSIDAGSDDGDDQANIYDPSKKENKNTDDYLPTKYDENESTSSDDETLMITLDGDILLSHAEIHAEVMSILTSIFQNALNLASSENGCCIPVFGLWGTYTGATKCNTSIASDTFENTECAAASWIPSQIISPSQQNNSSAWEGDEADVHRLLLSSPSITGHCQQGSFRSIHRVYSIPRQSLPLYLSTLHGLSCVLLAQCPPQVEANKAMVTCARHCYHIDLMKEKKAGQMWRMGRFAVPKDETRSAVEVYRESCRRKAMFFLERATSPWIYETVPMWGPSEGNPLLSLSASVSWGAISVNDTLHEETDGFLSPSKATCSALIQLPLKIRSSNFVPTSNELMDMEYSLQSAAFDPLGIGAKPKTCSSPREPIFFASAQFDSNLPCSTLSANVRCVLAALLRCGSLGPDALPGHLTRKEILSKLGGSTNISKDEETNDVIGTMSESESALRAGLKNVSSVTARLVEAMDWAEIETISTNADVDRGIADTFQRIGASGLFPSPPEEFFTTDNIQYQPCSIVMSNSISKSKGSPPGRLLSILFAHMARLRTPPSMMSLWLAFVDELRSRYDNNESLPNLGCVPGLDEQAFGGQYGLNLGLGTRDCPVLGHRANFAAFVNSSEPDPDRNYCIINQKLQVFNICIESKMALEALESKESEKLAIDEDDSYSNSDNDEFFDPEEEVISFESDSRKSGCQQIEAMLRVEAAAVIKSGHNRIGARCPVPDRLPLIRTGGQVYAPYLQRTTPMTDEEEEKQNKLFGKRCEFDLDQRLSIRDRIEISQRLHAPKLMSDMSAFKAANPGCIFEDFVSWYGNPQNPLSEEVNGETIRRAREFRSELSPEAAEVLALEEASDAIAILMSLRTFWEESFEESEPCPAAEQQPLFDPYSAAEMVLHSFETIHPSLLMGQVLAVNLKSAEFVLETASQPVQRVPRVQQCLQRMNTAVNDALEMLTKDASPERLHIPSQISSDENSLVHVSTLTIRKCDEACNAIGELEILLSRALALWKLCPDTNLVNTLIQCENGSFVFLESPNERGIFLNAIKEHQSRSCSVLSENGFPEAAMREYVIKNDDLEMPCQLNARLVSDLKGGHSALLALTKSCYD